MAIETILAQTLQEVAKIPREAEVEAGIVLAVLGFTMTFVILSILTVSIKLMSMAVTKYVKWKESRKKAVEAVEVEAPVTPAPTPVAPAAPAPSAELPVPPEVIAAAIAGVRAYMEEKTGRRKRREKYAPVNYWVLAWRLEAGFNLNDLDYLAWNKSRKPRW